MSELLDDSFANVGAALKQLEKALIESLESAPGSLAIDGTIQRFEFCIELMWKLLRRLILEQGQEVTPLPKPVLQKAYAVGWLNDEVLWLKMLDDRNKTSHTYQQELAMQIYGRIKTYYPVLQSTFNQLLKQYQQPTM